MKKDSKNKLAASYADAMFEAARAAKAGSRVLSDVETLKSALEEDPKIVGMLANPLWKTDAKKAAVSDRTLTAAWRVTSFWIFSFLNLNRSPT